MKTRFNDLLKVDYPIIVAPMFLVSNVAMITAAQDSGISAAIPALNYRTDAELRAAIDAIRAHSHKAFWYKSYCQQIECQIQKSIAHLR